MGKQTTETGRDRDLAISAGLLAAAIVVSVVRDLALSALPIGSLVSAWISIALWALMDIAFVAVVVYRAVSPAHRLPALVLGIVAVLVDVGTLSALLLSAAGLPAVVLWISSAATILFVLVWGAGRRRHRTWLIGVVPASVVSLVYAWLLQSGHWPGSLGPTVSTIAFTMGWYGVIAAGCLLCWGADALGSRSPVEPAASEVNAPTNTLAIAAVVVSVLLPPVGVILGHRSLSQISRTGEPGRELAIAALVLGYLGTALVVLVLGWFGLLIFTLMSA